MFLPLWELPMLVRFSASPGDEMLTAAYPRLKTRKSARRVQLSFRFRAENHLSRKSKCIFT